MDRRRDGRALPWRARLRAALETRFEPPEFCRIRILFTSLVAAELVVVVLWLAPGGALAGARFFAASVLALWLAVLSLLSLCQARGWLARLPLVAGALAAWLIPVAICLLGGALVASLDEALLGPGASAGFDADAVWRTAAIAAVLGGLLLRYFHVQEMWLRNERAQARAAVEALQARIRPHFLFNSLNSIASLVRRDAVTAERALEDLADLFRAALGAGDGMCSLREELDLCRQYLSIEKLRLADRLQVAWQVDEDLAAQVRVPRLSLQPLVENAVHHGIARLAGGGRILVSVQRSGDGAEIEILNPCPVTGRSPDQGNRHAQRSIEQRLAYHFGDAARMTAACRDGYYRCTVRVPLEEPGHDAHPHR
ncbi:MAG: histidine kinase [Lysobacteraceae bacterium]|nr:MAG: histidine kinase [Xanthomonadaceae bacterium]